MASQTCPCLLSAQGSREPGDMLPRKLKRVLRREFWSSFQNLLVQGTEVRWPFCFDPIYASWPPWYAGGEGCRGSRMGHRRPCS